MERIALSVGYTANIENLKRILDCSENIASVYTGGLAGKISGGRPDYLQELDTLRKCVGLSHDRGVLCEIALNAPCGLQPKSNTGWWDGIREYLSELEDCGVDYVIASHPFLMKLVKEKTGMKLVASTICEIATARAAAYYEDIGADIIIPSMNVNYEMEALRRMKSNLKRAKIRIMLNEHCLGDCPWRRFHHNHYSHSNEELDYHFNCKTQFLTKPYLLLTNNAIRPEDLINYFDITHDFKIVGRMVPIEDLLSRIKAYSRGQYDGNYVSLFDSSLSRHFNIPNDALDGLYAHKINCSKLCEDCGYCMELCKRSLGKSNPVTA